MSHKISLSLVPAAITELNSVSQLLHLTHHRNKNQHRPTKWYKSLSMLRRHVLKLLSHMEDLERAAAVAQRKETKYVSKAREILEARVKFIDDWLMGKCYLAFSNLVADNQYASLGLMLLGTLARVRTIIRPWTKAMTTEEDANTDIIGHSDDSFVQPHDFGEVIKRSGLNQPHKQKSLLRGEDEHVNKILKSEKKTKKPNSQEVQNDVEQEETSLKPSKKPEQTKTDTLYQEQNLQMSAPSLSKKPKKKRKKGDELDDLFSTLL